MWRSVLTMVCLVKKNPFSDYWKKEGHIHMPWSLWQAWASPVSAERQHSRTQAIQKVAGVHQQQLPETRGWVPNREMLCWACSLQTRKIRSGKRRFGAANSEVSVYFKHKPAKNSKFQTTNHLLKVRCMLKSFPGPGPLLAIKIYTGEKNMPNWL